MSTDVYNAFEAQAQPAGFIFAQKSGNPRSYTGAQKALHRICDRTGVRRISWHVLRHTFASLLAARGVPLTIVQKFLGHSTISMTERYAHLAPSSLHDAMTVLEDTVPVVQSWAPGGQHHRIPLMR